MNNESNKLNLFKSSDNVYCKLEEKGQGDNCTTTNTKVMGNPRKCLLNNENIRSKSLPDCHVLKENDTNTTNLNVLDENNENDVWYNTWPEKLQKNDESQLKINGCDNDMNDNLKYKQLTLNEALDTFQLAYNPITKQLQLAEKPNCVNIECASPCACDSISDNTSASDKLQKGHHRTAGASSFSSTISSLSDPSSSGSLIDNDDCSSSSNQYKSNLKKKSFSGFFSRKVFSSTGSWRLFGSGKSSSTESLNIDLVASSSALIQHIRPPSLPAKDSEEERRHRDEYEAILQIAKKREIEYSKVRRLKQERQLKQEEQLSAAAKIWTNNILPSWDSMYNQKKTRDLWWQGLPPSVRGKVWILAIGNELNITTNLYQICLARAQERLKIFDSKTVQASNKNDDQESSMDVIQLDIARTFPNLGIFQKGGPYFNILHDLLAAYVCYRPDVGYVQGMSFLAAVLILNMEPVDAFICFANLVNRPLMLAAFTVNQIQLNAYFAVYNVLFKENLPKLYQHFHNVELSPDLYLLDWLYTVFAKAMPLDLACRVWDLYLRDGDEFIFRTALGVLNQYKEILLNLDFLDGAQFLTRLPDDMSSNELFDNIKSMVVSSKKRTFLQLFDKCQQTKIDDNR